MVEECINAVLSKLTDRERLIEISSLIEGDAYANIIDVESLKTHKEKILRLAHSAPDQFLYIGLLFYLKFIQSIKITNLVVNFKLITEYLRIIEIVQNLLTIETGLPKVDYRVYFEKIVDSIDGLLAFHGSYDNALWCLYVIKKFSPEWQEKISETSIWINVDFEIASYIRAEESLENSLSIIWTVKALYGLILPNSISDWSQIARDWLDNSKNDEVVDMNLFVDVISFLSYFDDEMNYGNNEINEYCKKFKIDPNSMKTSNLCIRLTKIPVFNYDYTFILTHFIGFINQIQYKRNLSILKRHVKVYEYYCLLNMKNVCVKMYKGNDPDIIKKYSLEVDISRNISKTSEIALEYFGDFIFNDRLFLIIELCQEDLFNLMMKKDKKKKKKKQAKFSNSDIAFFSHSLIKGLCQLKNNQKIYHRDIKPQNIGVTFEGEFKIFDFDVSENIATSDSEEYGISPHGAKGTYRYVPPEVDECWKKGNEEPYSREKADVFSLGCVIFEMRYGGDQYEKCMKSRNSLEIKIQETGRKLPWLSRLFTLMLCQDFNQRPRFNSLLDIIEHDSEFLRDRDYYSKEVRRKSK